MLQMRSSSNKFRDAFLIYHIFCPDQVEDETHVMYNKLREELFIHASYINVDFMQMSSTDKLVVLFSESTIIQRCAKTCNDIFKIRKIVAETGIK